MASVQGADGGPVDPRIGLGIRPGSTLPRLQLNERSVGLDSAHNFADGDAQSSAKGMALSLSIPSSPNSLAKPYPLDEGQKRHRRPTVSKVRKQAAPRGLLENRKLLAHLLDRLEERLSCPDLLQLASEKARNATPRHRGKEKTAGRIGKVVIAAAQSGIGVGQGDSMYTRSQNDEVDDEGRDLPDEEQVAGHAEVTFDLIDQTRGLLALAHRQGVGLLEHSNDLHHELVPPLKPTKAGRLSTISSPVTAKRPTSPNHASSSLLHPATISGASLHRRLSDVIRSVIMVDCLHQIRLFRPSQPPNALQSACLDVATFLFQSGDLSGKIEMTDVVVEGLHTMPPTMLDRTVGWLEGRVGDLLKSSNALRAAGLSAKLTHALCAVGSASSGSPLTAKRIHDLLLSICLAKADASLDLLQVVATGQIGARRIALEMLHRIWPGVMGHNRIAETIRIDNADSAFGAHTHATSGSAIHYYMPWRISSHDPLPDFRNHCLVCETEIHGFCVRCSLCNEQCHLHCLRASTEMFAFEVLHLSENGTSAPRSVQIKYSQVAVIEQENTRFQKRAGPHDLRVVNLFTTTKCASCQAPIWGTMGNAYACTLGCQQLFHSQCVGRHPTTQCRPGQHVVVNELTGQKADPFEISLIDLTRSFETERQKLCLDEHDLACRSFDEIAILFGSLWLQHKILESGLSNGSIALATQDVGRNAGRADPLGLRPVLKRYANYLSASRSQASSASTDFASSTGIERPLAEGFLFCRRLLTYLAALLRSPRAVDNGATTHSLLDPFGDWVRPAEQPSLANLEAVPMEAILSGFDADLAVRDPYVIDILLRQMSAIGLCTDQRGSPHGVSQRAGVANGNVIGFPLPLLMDATPSVELLIIAIEVLLDDLDLSHNEQGFVLLNARAWPSLLCSPYALERLGGAVISWIMNEDESLHVLIKQYASHNTPLPGVRPIGVNQAYGGTSSIPLYTSDRSRVLAEYAAPWCRALYDLDPGLYIHMLYERSKVPPTSQPPVTFEEENEPALTVADTALDRLMSAVEGKVMFGGHADIMIAWLEDLGELARMDHAFRLLPRVVAYLGTPGDPANIDAIWEMFRSISLSSSADHARVCMWIRTFSVSGVSVPWELMQHLMDQEDQLSLHNIKDLIVAAVNNDSQSGADLFKQIACDLFDAIAVALLGAERGNQSAEDEEEALSQALHLVLKAYGVLEQDIQASSLAGAQRKDQKYATNQSKRKRLTIAVEQVGLRKETISSTAALLAIPRLPSSKLVDFLWLLSSRASLASNVDGFMYEIALELFETLWALLPAQEIRPRLMKLLLRLLTVNSSSLLVYVRDQMRVNSVVTRDRLLDFLFGLVDDETNSEHRNASTGAVTLVIMLFEEISDPNTTSPDTLAVLGNVLPTQLSTLSRYFADYLIRSDDETRLHFLTKLARLRRVVPNWPILSWTTLEDLLGEQVAAVTQITSWRGSQVGSALSETQMVRANLIALGLEMLASGIEISWTTAQRFQQHVASACALPWSIPSEGVVHLILPALRAALDSPHHLSPGGQSRKMVIVGALFVPVVIDFGNELRKHDYMTQRCLLDIIHVTIYKQELRTVELAVLGALQTIADYAAAPSSTENRLLALRILQTALSRIAATNMLRVTPPIFSSVAKAFVGEMVESGDAAIVEQCRMLLRSIIDTFGKSGMFVQVFKVDSVNSRWSQEKSSIHRAVNVLVGGEGGSAVLDAIFADAADILKKDSEGLQDVLASLQSFAAINEMELSEDAAENLGLLISRVTKHVAEWAGASFEPDAMLCVCRYLLNHIPLASSPPLLHQVSTFLLVALSRFDVRDETLEALLQTASAVATRCSIENTMEIVIFEEATRKGLYDPQMRPKSMISVMKCILANHKSQVDRLPRTTQAILDAASASSAILSRQHPVYATPMDADVSLGLLSAAAHLLIAAETVEKGLLARQLVVLADLSAQTRCELFAQLLLAELPISILSRLCPIIARSASLCLRATGDLLSVADTGGEGSDMLSSTFNMIQLAILHMDEQSSEGFWDRTWPDWHRLLTISTEKTCVNAPLRTVSQSAFLELVTFLGLVRSPLLVSRSENISDVVSVIQEWSQTNAGPGGVKLDKAQNALRMAGQQAEGFDIKGVRRKIEADMLAGEKLKSLRSRK